MTTALKVFYAGVWVAILWVTTWASLHQNVLMATAALWADPWGRATFFDTYFAFTTIFLWICYKEKSWALRALWFVLIMTLGNIAVAPYLLIQLFQLKPGQPIETLLLRGKPSRSRP